MEDSNTSSFPETIGYLLEDKQVFTRSLLWELQQHYFAERGVEAWRQEEVPHYVTSNPTVANSYAEIVFAFWCDRTMLAPHHEPLTLCELGAGSGRFAFHFLSRLLRLCEQMDVAPTSFRYVLTDLAVRNLEFWRQHPRFQPFFASGMLEMALFDINCSDRLILEPSSQTIEPGELRQPLVAIANYVFDSIPQELYYIDDGQCYQCLVSLLIEEDPNSLTATELLPRLHYRYDYQPFTTAAVGNDTDNLLQTLLADYQRQLSDSHLLFPATGLRCLQRLRALSQSGLLLLSADKGDRRLSALQGKSPPHLVHHGSFSLNVNYHAFQRFCEQSGGVVWFPECDRNSINVGCLLFLNNTTDHRETQRAYQRHIHDFSPDDFYSITKHARQHIPTMALEDILAYLRLSFYDSHQFGRYLPRLLELAPSLDPSEREALTHAIEQVWKLYFPLGENLDLANKIASLLYAIDNYPLALTYFQHSIEIYGQDTGTLYNMAVCHQLLEQRDQAQTLLHKVLEYDPGNQDARTLYSKRKEAEGRRQTGKD